MDDIYCYPGTSVLKNHFEIKDQQKLSEVESELSQANMLLLSEQCFSDFNPRGLRYIHEFLFSDVYDWAGKYRTINISKKEQLLAGKSIWYANDENIKRDLRKAFVSIAEIKWNTLPKKIFAKNLAQKFSPIWQVHPFREGNTRTTVMFLTLFVQANGYQIDMEYIASQAKNIRDSFVLASTGKYAEYESLENLLYSAIKNRKKAKISSSVKIESSYYKNSYYLAQGHDIRSGEYNEDDYAPI